MGRIGDERKQEIIQAAIQVFGKNGFHKAKMGEIAEQAGIGKGTIYEYFSSKKELFEDMLKSIVDEYFAGAKNILIKSESVKEKLILFANYHGRFMSSHFELAENTLKGTEPVSEKMRTYLLCRKKEFFESMQELLKEGINSRELTEGSDSEDVICMLLGSINQMYVHNLHKGVNDPGEVDPVPVIELLFKGIGKAMNND